MATEHNALSNPEVSYEHRDLGARNILLFFAILAVAGVIVHFLVWGIYGFFDQAILNTHPQTNPIAPYAKTPPSELLMNTPMVNLDKFGEPRLQSNEIYDMKTFNQVEDEVLDSKPWVDPQGFVHLPIEVAMQELAQRGLPARAGGVPPSEPVKSLSGAPEENAPETMRNNNAPAVRH